MIFVIVKKTDSDNMLFHFNLLGTLKDSDAMPRL